jgi:hypothetical protein
MQNTVKDPTLILFNTNKLLPSDFIFFNFISDNKLLNPCSIPKPFNMRSIFPGRCKIFVLSILSVVMYANSFGQLQRKNVINQAKALARKSEANVVLLNTQVMSDVLLKCIEQGIGQVQLIFTRLKMNDVDEYVFNHPEARGYEKDLVGKMTVLLKVEGENITDETFTGNNGSTNKLQQLMSSAGLVRLDKPYGDLPLAARTVYLDVGSICPPPTSCN